MTDKEKIIKLLQTRMEKLQNSDSRDDSIAYYEVGHIIDLIKALPEEPVSEELEEAAKQWHDSVKYRSDLRGTPIECFKAGAQWDRKQVVNKVCEAFCKVECDGHPPRSTCTSLGTCKKYDDFRKAL